MNSHRGWRQISGWSALRAEICQIRPGITYMITAFLFLSYAPTAIRCNISALERPFNVCYISERGGGYAPVLSFTKTIIHLTRLAYAWFPNVSIFRAITGAFIHVWNNSKGLSKIGQIFPLFSPLWFRISAGNISSLFVSIDFTDTVLFMSEQRRGVLGLFGCRQFPAGWIILARIVEKQGNPSSASLACVFPGASSC